MQRALATTLTALLAIVGAAACGPKETPEQKVERLRYHHKITPLGYTTIMDAATGEPRFLVDLQIVNQDTQKLDHLTVLVRVVRADGSGETREHFTLDLSDQRPGVGVQMAGTVPGLVVEEDDEVFLEIEQDLSPEAIRRLPEFADVSGAS